MPTIRAAVPDRPAARGPDLEAARRRIERAEWLLERAVRVPLIGRRVGLDVMLDLIPGVGPVAATALGGWIVWEARRLGLSRWQMARMAGNVGTDLLLSAIPWVGAIPDFFFRSNSRNLRIIRRHLDRHAPVDAAPR